MNIRQTITVINQMQTDAIIGGYAIGGAVGAAFYLEPVATLDIDIFITFPAASGSLLVNPEPIFDYLKVRGATMEGEHVVVEGWPVQFLPASQPLLREALDQASMHDIEGAAVRVFTAEHLAAIALQTGRPKDKARLVQFIESGILDMRRFQEIIARYGLLDPWQRFRTQFLNDET